MIRSRWFTFQWQGALKQWRSIENIVILVELPPATQPEAVLLAQNLPNLIWLADSGAVHAGPTRDALQTLRDARCNLVGSVVNHAPGGLKTRFSRWTTAVAAAFLLCADLADVDAQTQSGPPTNAQFAITASAPQATAPADPIEQARNLLRSTLSSQNPPIVPASTRSPSPVNGDAANSLALVNQAPPAGLAAPTPTLATPAPTLIETNLAFSATAAGHRAGWQTKLTLGPGDVLDLGLFGQPETARKEVPIGPDGRISFLQAQDVVASGLTVDDLRTNLEQELGKFYRSPRVTITPVAYNSKKYYVLGKVANRGVFPLDRPVTIVEAVARAKGLETGILDQQNSVDLVDLQRSFLMRQGKRLPVNLEGLFQQGDLSQNVVLEPEDYLYFAAGALKEVYVLGEVRLPGPVPYTEQTTVIRALAARGGFTDRAYKSAVVVVRGSLNSPQIYKVDTLATVDARGLDFKLQPKDIVYVNWRPFIKAEELLDLAATAFTQSAVAAWAGKNIGPLITHPFLPDL
jgi:protein involved in polysaccharide export with SLBB domain